MPTGSSGRKSKSLPDMSPVASDPLVTQMQVGSQSGIDAVMQTMQTMQTGAQSGSDAPVMSSGRKSKSLPDPSPIIDSSGPDMPFTHVAPPPVLDPGIYDFESISEDVPLVTEAVTETPEPISEPSASSGHQSKNIPDMLVEQQPSVPDPEIDDFEVVAVTETPNHHSISEPSMSSGRSSASAMSREDRTRMTEAILGDFERDVSSDLSMDMIF